jgi:lipoate---protein ligase
MGTDWSVSSWRGSAASFHAREPAADTGRCVWWFEVDRPALVLGSAQPESTIDVDRCRREGIDVVRRRSGGGSVLMIPGEILWVDVVVPAGDPWWDDDVGRAMWWVGDLWVEVLGDLGVARTEVHRGPLHTTAWSRSVCFDGLGAGEVTAGGRKAVGVSQRRTRRWSRIQTAIHRTWRGDLVESLIREPRPSSDGPVPPWVLPAGIGADEVRSALVRALSSR